MKRAFSIMVAVLVCACVDPYKAFDDFQDRVPPAQDASNDAPVFEEIPDMTGDYLMRVRALDFPIWAVAHIEFTEGTPATLTLTLQPVAKMGDAPNSMHTSMVVGTAQPGRTELNTTSSTTLPVDPSGRFTAHFKNLLVPTEASPIGQTLDADITFSAQIVHMDCFEGTGEGRVNTTGSALQPGPTRFAAVRVASTTDMPQGVLECPAMTTPDASPDATPDASPATLKGPAVDGQFYTVMTVTGGQVHFIATVDETAVDPADTMTVELTPLDQTTRMRIGSPAMGKVTLRVSESDAGTTLTQNAAGTTFSASVVGYVLPAAASPVGLDTTLTGTFSMTIDSTNCFEGGFTGSNTTLAVPVQLTDSPTAGQRVADGTEGAALPAAATVCP